MAEDLCRPYPVRLHSLYDSALGSPGKFGSQPQRQMATAKHTDAPSLQPRNPKGYKMKDRRPRKADTFFRGKINWQN